MAPPNHQPPSSLASNRSYGLASTEPAEQRTLRQLLEALLFEGVTRFQSSPVTSEGSWWLVFQLGRLQGRCRGRIRGFGRIRLALDTLTLTLNDQPVSVTLDRIVAELPGGETRHQALLAELNSTIDNVTCLEQFQAVGDRRQLSAEQLDSAMHEGHPYHPCFKSRLGFCRSALRAYSPETSSGFQLHWLAVPRARLHSQLPAQEEAFWQQELGQDTAFLLRAAFNRFGLNWLDYAALPVHPWHWQQLNAGPYRELLERDGIHSLGPLGDRYRPGQSLRSLFNISNPDRACIKLPLGIVNTSSRRHLEPHSVPSAPQISEWLTQITQNDPRFQTDYPLRLLPEYASLAWCPATCETSPHRESLDGELGAIWRTSIRARLTLGEQAVPANALFAVEPDGRPFIQPWIEEFGLEAWLVAALNRLILPVWHLLAAHGIGLEAHAQNSLLVLRNGWPVALMLRDFHDSVEYVESFLPTAAPRPDFGHRQAFYDQAPEDRYYRMGQPEALRELVMDTLFVFNLSELGLLLTEHYGLPESRFWQHVARCLSTHAEAHPDLQHRLAQLDAFAPRVRTESLIARKLCPDPTQAMSHQVANPLA